MSENTNIDNFRKQCAERDAVLLSWSAIAGTNTVRIVRRWAETWEPPKTTVAADLLRLYASAKNESPQRWLIDPAIGSASQLPGKFWNVRVDASDGKSGDLPQGIIQTIQQVTDISDATGLVAADHLDSQDETVLRQFAIKDGTGRSRVMAWYCLLPTTETRQLVMETISRTELQSALVGASSAWKFAKREWINQQDGTVVFTIVFRRVGWRRWAPTMAWEASADYASGDQRTNGGNGYDATEDHTAGLDFAADLAAGLWVLTRTPDLLSSKTNPSRKTEARVYSWTGFDKEDRTAIRDALATATFTDEGYHIAQIEVSDAGDGSVSFQQTQTPKWSELAEDGRLLGQESLEPFSARPGALASLRTIYSNQSAAQLAGVTDTTPAGYILVKISPDFESNGLYSRVYDYQKVTWTTWSNDLTADFLHKDNAGTPRESRTREWLGIALASAEDARLWCENQDNAIASGYTVTEVRIRDGRNGSITVFQTCRKRLENEPTETGTRQLNPHGFKPGTVAAVVTTYTDFFKESDLPSGSIVTAGSNYIENTKFQQPDGLWARRVITMAPTWAGTWETKVRRSVSGVGGWDETSIDVAHGVSAATAASAFSSAQAPDAGNIVVSAEIDDAGEGERVITRRQEKVTAAVGVPIIVNLKDPSGRTPGSVARVWPGLSTAAKDTLVASGGSARSNFSLEAKNYLHLECTASPSNGGRKWTVTQVARLRADGESAIESPYFQNTITLKKVWTRSRDNKTKTATYSMSEGVAVSATIAKSRKPEGVSEFEDAIITPKAADQYYYRYVHLVSGPTDWA